MSYNEYNDMINRSQNNGLYHMFTFDIKNSRSMNKNELITAEKKLYKIAKDMFIIIKKLEKIMNEKILLESHLCSGQLGFLDKQDPICFSDAIGITIYRNSLPDAYINGLFNALKKEYNLDCDIHYADGYYETNEYNKGGYQYYRGYCFQYLTSLHKR